MERQWKLEADRNSERERESTGRFIIARVSGIGHNKIKRFGAAGKKMSAPSSTIHLLL